MTAINEVQMHFITYSLFSLMIFFKFSPDLSDAWPWKQLSLTERNQLVSLHYDMWNLHRFKHSLINDANSPCFIRSTLVMKEVALYWEIRTVCASTRNSFIKYSCWCRLVLTTLNYYLLFRWHGVRGMSDTHMPVKSLHQKYAN